ncbi:hypothetical protein NSZ01_26260 [Nocardioides szechwanensis]|uniref:Uncharacterized protein n=1 Tax=Nocardioides szechwanensis TaxID=1005944 RepID=A0A1H0AIG9_9ACTN|nr:hypothetical protein [Nocardioides szechwanensis]GEP34858.1 hypothetical protein NSZ01_26260 [Nocardioides szechwanensis]SDN32853.1 hypothetical protein SAMN05192576_2036 [Nocardioides szechwanensis]
MTGLDRARAALAVGDWPTALDAVGRERSTDDHPELLKVRAQAAYGVGELELSIASWEDLYSRHLGDGAEREAAWAAGMVAMFLMIDTGLMAPVRGWLRRAERLVGEDADAPAHAVVAMTRAYERVMCGDPVGALAAAALAIELGERLEVPAAVTIGRTATGRVLIAEGRVADGLDLLDEVAVQLMSGEVDPLTTGMMYCELICAAQGLALHDRAREWTEVMERWRHGSAYGGVHGRCRVHRAEILRVTGPCDLAEAEALGACEELRPWMRREFGWPLVELGNIRLRKGDLEGAEEAFLAAHEHAWSPHPGLALLRLAQGDVTTAAALVADAIEHPIEVPWKERPPFGDLRLAPLYDAQAEIAAVAGDAGTLSTAASALRDVAERHPSPGLAASAALATAREALLAGDTDAAIDASSGAVAAWADLGAPYETAGARVVLGHAHEVAGSAGRARMEWEAALAGFAGFGAPGRADQVRELLDGRAVGPPPVPTSGGSISATFRRAGRGRSVCFRGHEVLVPDLKGFRYLERLLAAPGREFHVLDLVAVEQGTLRSARADAGLDGVGVPAVGLPVLDDEARAAYRRRLGEVEEDIAEAEEHDDLARLTLAQRDRDYLVAELTRAVGLGGRARTVGGTSERARTSVARSLRYALRRLGEEHADLGAHLDRTVRTGTYCSYEPDPLTPVVWELGG